MYKIRYRNITNDLPVWYSNTQNDSSPGAAIFSLHTLALSSGRSMNYDEKQFTGKKFLSCSFYLYRFRKYVSYGFPIINVCNPGVHYETPCIRTQSAPRSEHFQPLLYKTNLLMPYKQKSLFVLGSVQNTQTQCDHHVEFLSVKPVGKQSYR